MYFKEIFFTCICELFNLCLTITVCNFNLRKRCLFYKLLCCPKPILCRAGDLKNSVKYGSGPKCRWALFTAWAFGFKLHLIFPRVELKTRFNLFYLVDFHGRNWRILGFYENKTQHWALFSTKTNQGRFYFHWA